MSPPFNPAAPGPGLWRRTPPAIFPPIFGLFGLGLAWREAAGVVGVPGLGGLAETFLGAVTLLYLFAFTAYLAKVLRRPALLAEEARVLPGRTGLAAMSLSFFLFAATLVPHAPVLAWWLGWAAAFLHLACALLVTRVLLALPGEWRAAGPVLHLLYVGFVLWPLSLVPLGVTGLSTVILWATIPVAVLIWGDALLRLGRKPPPAPLRPLLAIHLAPASLFAIVAARLGLEPVALVFALLALVLATVMLSRVRWLTEAGFSPLWGAFTFPSAAAASALLAVGASQFWGAALGLLLVAAASAIVPPIAVRVMQLWAKGELAAKTNAATA